MARQVLIVEDSETCAETLVIALESIPGLEVRVIHSAASALETLHGGAHEVAAIITDLNLDHSRDNGFDLIRQLRAEPRFAALPVLLISGDTDPRLPERALAQGANAFFPKPYSPLAVRKKLEQLLC